MKLLNKDLKKEFFSKKIFVLFILLMLVSVAYAADDCTSNQEIAQERVQAQYAFYEYRAQGKIVGMQAVIDYLESEEIDVFELETINEDLETTISSAKEAEDKQALDDITKEGKDLVKNFKEKANELVDENDLSISKVRQAVADSLKNNEDIEAKKDTAVNAARNHASNFLKSKVCLHENAQGKIKNAGGDVDELESDLNEVKTDIDELEAAEQEAYEKCGSMALVVCSEGENAVQLRKQVNEKLKQLRERTRVTGQELAVTKVKNALLDRIEKSEGRLDDDELVEIKDDVEKATTMEEVQDARKELNDLQIETTKGRQQGRDSDDENEEDE